jgi:hypothetical protein
MVSVFHNYSQTARIAIFHRQYQSPRIALLHHHGHHCSGARIVYISDVVLNRVSTLVFRPDSGDKPGGVHVKCRKQMSALPTGDLGDFACRRGLVACDFALLRYTYHLRG